MKIVNLFLIFTCFGSSGNVSDDDDDDVIGHLPVA